MSISLEDLKVMLRMQSGMALPTFSVEGDRVTAEKTCSATGQRYVVHVPLRSYEQWQSGMKIQDAMPMLSADQREFLISGQTPAEFDELFGDDKDEE